MRLNRDVSLLQLCVYSAEVIFCFINDTPDVDGDILNIEFDLRGCADVMCTVNARNGAIITEDCTYRHKYILKSLPV